MKRIMSFILAAAMVCSLMVQAAYAQELTAQGVIAPPENWTQYTPMERLFRVSGSDKTFILLDKTEDGYLIFSYDDYGKKAFDENSGVVFDVNSKNNIGYFLNNEFLTKGYMDTTVNELKKLPEDIVKHMNEHTWNTEPVTASAAMTSQKARVALMSQTEYVEYAGKFGVKDNSRTWMFRTARALASDGKSILRYFDDTSGHYTSSWPSNSALYIRPMFCLDETFFTNVKLNSAYMGSYVKELVASASSEQLLAAGYSQSEIDTIKNTSENSVIDASIVFPEAGIYSQDASCSVVTGTGGSYELTVSGDGSGRVSFTSKDGGSKACDIKINGSGKKGLIFTLKKDGIIIESLKKDIFCADVYQKRLLDDSSTRGVYMDIDREISNDDLNVLNCIGIKNIKLDFSWKSIEPQRGKYDFSTYENSVEKLISEGIGVCISLTDDNDLYSSGEKEAALSGAVSAIMQKFPTISAIELANAVDTESVIVGGYADNRFTAFGDYDISQEWYRPFYKTVSDVDSIIKSEPCSPYMIWIPYSTIIDERGQITEAFDDLGKINQYTQGYISAVEVDEGIAYITSDGLKILGDSGREGAMCVEVLSSGKGIYEGFTESDSVSLTAKAVSEELRNFVEKYRDELVSSTQTERMLYRLDQAAAYFEQQSIMVDGCTEEINRIGEVCAYFCSEFKNGGISVSQDIMGKMLTDMYDILKHSAAVYACIEESDRDTLSPEIDLSELKASSDPLVRSSYIRCADIQARRAMAISEREYTAAGYYDLVLKNLYSWSEALLKGDNSAYELFEIKDDILILKGDGGTQNEMATLVVKRLEAEDAESELIDYIGQIPVDENGEYMFTYKLKNRSGVYLLSVRLGSSTVYSREFVFASEMDKNGLVRAINMAESESDILSVVKEYSSVLKIYSEELSGITEDYTFVLSCIFSNRKEIDSIEKLVSLTKEALLLDELHHADSAASVNDILERYAYLLRLETHNSWKTYINTLNSETRNNVLKDLEAGQFGSMEDVVKAFDTAVVLRGVEGSSYRELMTVLMANNDIIGIDFSDYEKLPSNSRESILKEIAGKKYSSIEELKKDFEDKANRAIGNNNGTAVYPGGGGSGISSVGNTGNLDGITVAPPSSTEEPKPSAGFSDLNGFEWAEEAIENLFEINVINGTGDNLFEPQRAVKREEFVKMIVLAFGLESNDDKILFFTDVPRGDWSYEYICAAVDNGIITGETESLFGYGKQITREDAAVILYRTAKLKNIEIDGNKNDFTDFEEISDYAKEAVAGMSGAGIITGMGNGAFEPKEAANRAQAAKLIYELRSIGG